jgi:hypothetical protein
MDKEVRAKWESYIRSLHALDSLCKMSGEDFANAIAGLIMAPFCIVLFVTTGGVLVIILKSVIQILFMMFNLR